MAMTNRFVSILAALTFVVLAEITGYTQEREHSISNKLQFHIFTSEDDGFFVNSVIVEGRNEILLIDAQLSKTSAEKVLEQIRRTKKNLTKIYITHEHPDHFLGLEVFKDAFPDVEIFANTQVVKRINEIYEARLLKWQKLLGQAAARRRVEIGAFDGTSFGFEDSTAEIHKHLQGDTSENTLLWFPEERVVIAGDLVFDQMHVYTVETTAAGRQRWIYTLDYIRSLNPLMVIPGHSKPGKHFDALSSIEYTKQYLQAFEIELKESKTGDELIERMKRHYPNADLTLSIERAAAAMSKNRCRPLQSEERRPLKRLRSSSARC
jgi:glyoxylase-like metal-dependent hydrolase (beta-lactamase superfamily II)